MVDERGLLSTERELCAYVNGGGQWQQAEVMFQAILQAAKQEGVVAEWVAQQSAEALTYPNLVAYNALLRAYAGAEGQWQRTEKLFNMIQVRDESCES